MRTTRAGAPTIRLPGSNLLPSVINAPAPTMEPPNQCAVQDSRAHADEAVIGHRAAVEDRLMPDGHPRADHQRKARITVSYCAVLEVCLVAEDQWRVVAS